MLRRGPMTLDVSKMNDQRWMATSEWTPRQDEFLTGVVSGTGDTADEAVADMLDTLDAKIQSAEENYQRIMREERDDIERGIEDEKEARRG